MFKHWFDNFDINGTINTIFDTGWHEWLLKSMIGTNFYKLPKFDLKVEAGYPLNNVYGLTLEICGNRRWSFEFLQTYILVEGYVCIYQCISLQLRAVLPRWLVGIRLQEIVLVSSDNMWYKYDPINKEMLVLKMNTESNVPRLLRPVPATLKNQDFHLQNRYLCLFLKISVFE